MRAGDVCRWRRRTSRPAATRAARAGAPPPRRSNGSGPCAARAEARTVGLLAYGVDAAPAAAARGLADARLPLCPGARVPAHFRVPFASSDGGGPDHTDPDGLGLDYVLALPIQSTGGSHYVLEAPGSDGAAGLDGAAAGSCACILQQATWPDGAGNRRDGGRRRAAAVEARAAVRAFSVRGMRAEVEPLEDT